MRPIILAMSLLASHAFANMLHVNVTVLDGRQVVSKEKVASTLAELLQSGKSCTAKQAKTRVRAAMAEALKDVAPASNPFHAAFIGVFYACEVSRLAGIPCSPDRLPGMTEVVDLSSEAVETAMVPVQSETTDGVLVPAPDTVEVLDEEDGEEHTGDSEQAVSRFATSMWKGAKRRRLGPGGPGGPGHLGVVAAGASQRQQSSQEAYETQRAEFEQLGVPVLVNKLMLAYSGKEKAERRNQQLQAKVKNLTKKLATAKRQAQSSRELARKTAEDKNMFELQKLGKKREGRAGRWSMQSKFSMGLRCCLSTIAACDFGMMNMVDVSKQTVLRAVCMTGAAIITLMQSFCKEGLGLALEASSSSSNDWALFGAGFRSDATNTNIWR